MNIYVASGLENREQAAALIRQLSMDGHTITYDWTQRGDVRNSGDLAMIETAQREVNAVAEAELVILLLPGGKGTHTELGLALATRENKKIWIWSETEEVFGHGDATCVFYHHPEVSCLSCSFEELCSRVSEQFE